MAGSGVSGGATAGGIALRAESSLSRGGRLAARAASGLFVIVWNVDRPVPAKVSICVVAGFGITSVALAFGDPLSREVRDGVGFPLLIFSFLVGLYDVTSRQPSYPAVLALFFGLFGALVVGFDATREAFETDWILAVCLVVAVLGFAALTAIALRYLIARRFTGD